MLSVWRKPVEIYIGSSVLIIRDGSSCFRFDRSSTQPLDEVLAGLKSNVMRLKPGLCRRVNVFLSAALWPAATDGQDAQCISTPALKTIEYWLLGMGLLATSIAPLWSSAVELGNANASELQAILLVEPDSKTLLFESAAGVVHQQTFEPELSINQIQSHFSSKLKGNSEHILKFEFMETPSTEGLTHKHWNQHWGLI